MAFKHQTSETTIVAHAILMGVATAVNLLMLLLLIRHLKHKSLQHTSLKFLSLAAVVLSLLSSIMPCAISNNIPFPSLHKYINFIDDHCSTLLVTYSSLATVCKFTIWLFLLCKIRVFFKATPFKLSRQAFYAHVVVYVVIAIGIVYAVLMSYEPILMIYIGSKGTNKLCFVSLPTADNASVSIMLVGLFDGLLIEMFLLYILYSKAKQLEEYQANNEVLSPYFSRRDKALIDVKVIKQCCVGGVISLVSSCICAVCVMVYDMIYLFAVMRAVVVLPVICSFDIELPVICDLTNEKVMDDKGQAEMIQRREEYLRKIMKEYYKAPQRRVLVPNQNMISVRLEKS
eukprot:475831_1